MSITSSKLLWIGLTLIVAVSVFVPSTVVTQIGAIVMIVGVILAAVDR